MGKTGEEKIKEGTGWRNMPCLAKRRWTLLYQPMMLSDLIYSWYSWYTHISVSVNTHFFYPEYLVRLRELKYNPCPLCANPTSLICILRVLCDWWSDEGPPRFYAKTAPSCCHRILSQVLYHPSPQLPLLLYNAWPIYWLQQCWLCCGWITVRLEKLENWKIKTEQNNKRTFKPSSLLTN